MIVLTDKFDNNLSNANFCNFFDNSLQICGLKLVIVYYNVIYFSQKTAVQNEVVLSYYRVCGLYFMAVSFVVTVELNLHCIQKGECNNCN